MTEAGRLVTFGEWQLDTVARHLIDSEGMVVALSGAEYRLLRVFLDHPQRVLTRDQLLNLTQGRDAELFERSIDLLVSRVRQRLNEDARTPAYIKTVRSEGYVFTMPVIIKRPMNDALATLVAVPAVGHRAGWTLTGQYSQPDAGDG